MRSPILMVLISFFLHDILHGQLAEGFRDELVSSEWDGGALGVDFVDSTHWVVWERNGRIWLVENGVKRTTPLLDISNEVMGDGDHGLISMVTDPNFIDNGFLYLGYVVDPWALRNQGLTIPDSVQQDRWDATIGRVTRYQIDLNSWSILDSSRLVLLGDHLTNGVPVLAPVHGMGGMTWGADGSLLVATGDGTTWIGSHTGGDDYKQFGYDSLGKEDGIISTAEDLGSYRAQYVDSYSGKVLRIDPGTGQGLASNPFYDVNDPDRPASKVWSLGLRNPFRITRVPGTGSPNMDEGDPGTLLIGDVGRYFYEELNIADGPGSNFGWPAYEGFIALEDFQEQQVRHPDADSIEERGTCPNLFVMDSLLRRQHRQHSSHYLVCGPDTLSILPTLVPLTHQTPMLAYGNSENFPEVTHLPIYDENGWRSFASIEEPISPATGLPFDGISSVIGDFCQGKTWPKDYHGRYFHADFAGWIKTMEMDAHGEVEVHAVHAFSESGRPTVFIKFNPHDDCLYYFELHYSSAQPRQLRRICFGGNAPPVAKIGVEGRFDDTPAAFQLDGSTSTDVEGPIKDFRWLHGTDTIGNKPQLSWSYPATTTHAFNDTLHLLVRDSQGLTDKTRIVLSLNNTPPDVAIVSPINGLQYAPEGEILDLSLVADVADRDHADAQLKYSWRIILDHNNHSHLDYSDTTRAPQVMMQTSPETPFSRHSYRVQLSVTDPLGLSGTDEIAMEPRTMTTAVSGSSPHYLLVYPNPADHWLQVRTDLKPSSAQLLNAQGIAILHWSKKDLETTLDLNNLPFGFYLLVLRLHDGRVLSHRLLVKPSSF
ncbi:MAG: PQQ-dependent sugar dehydrogenase [Saprospiraceae bacterium]|nr:PQQ-dependent sugar dehydrogenase [Saprospiraceae bacterium]